MPTTVLALLTLERELLEWSGSELVAGAPGVGTDGHAAGSRGSGGIYCYTSPQAAGSGWMSTGAAIPPDLVALALFSFAKEDGTTTGVLRWQRAARCDAMRSDGINLGVRADSGVEGGRRVEVAVPRCSWFRTSGPGRRREGTAERESSNKPSEKTGRDRR